MGEPIMSSQKIGPSSLARRVRSCTGACGSSDSMLPTTGLVGGCGIGLSLFLDGLILDGIVENVSPCTLSRFRHCEEHLRRSNPDFLCRSMDCFASLAMTRIEAMPYP